MSESPKVPATDPEASSTARVRRDGGREWPLLVSTAAVGVAVAAFAAAAWLRLGSTSKTSNFVPVYQDMLKTNERNGVSGCS